MPPTVPPKPHRHPAPHQHYHYSDTNADDDAPEESIESTNDGGDEDDESNQMQVCSFFVSIGKILGQHKINMDAVLLFWEFSKSKLYTI